MHLPASMDWRAATSELSAVAATAAAMVLRHVLPAEAPSADASTSSPPVVLVHGLLGGPTNFFVFRQRLVFHGIRNVAAFTYAPGIDVPRLARRLADMVRDVCGAAGTSHADVVGHSLGGTVARSLAESDDGGLVRRLVTLGSPSFADRTAPGELAVFGAADVLVAPPERSGPRADIRVIPGCGHLGLLFHPMAAALAARHLRRPATAPEHRAVA